MDSWAFCVRLCGVVWKVSHVEVNADVVAVEIQTVIVVQAVVVCHPALPHGVAACCVFVATSVVIFVANSVVVFVLLVGRCLCEGGIHRKLLDTTTLCTFQVLGVKPTVFITALIIILIKIIIIIIIIIVITAIVVSGNRIFINVVVDFVFFFVLVVAGG